MIRLLILVLAPIFSVYAEPLKVGFIIPLTGAAARMGESFTGVVEFANLKNITPIFQDDRCEGKTALSAYNQLRNQGVRIFYLACSGSILAVAPLAKRHRDLILTASAGSSKIRETGDEVLRFNPDALSVADALARLLTPELKPTTILYEEQDYAQSLTDRLAELLGADIQEQIPYRPDATSFSSEVIKIKQKGSTSIVLIPVSESAAERILRALSAAKLSTPVIGEVNLCDYPFHPSDFGLHGACVSARFEGAAFKAFIHEYTSRFGRPPAYPFYDAIGLDLLRNLDTRIGKSIKFPIISALYAVIGRFDRRIA
jgi:ABC-type branched-subunit amino acid transport system substrate-binding protein